jgi:hypothetical protein
MPNQQKLKIAPVASARDLRRFIELPHRIYANDPNWIPPLHSEVKKLLDRKKNPFFEHSDAALWLAWRGDEPVGRISAQINKLHIDRYADATGNFGFIEAFDDQEVFDALLATAEDWLKARGMKRSIGPYSLTVNDDIGVLIDGFDTAPMALMGHAEPYYAARLEQAGYRKAKDVLAYRLGRAELKPETVERMRRIADRFGGKEHIELRFIDMKKFESEMRLILDIYNDAWTENWGFLPLTPAEATAVIAAIRPIIRADQVIMASLDGETIGFIASIPDINELIADLRGRLLPFGWIKLLWRLKFRTPKGVRVMLAGVKSEYSKSALSGAVMSTMLGELVGNLVKSKHQTCEISWILEDNKASLGVTRLFAKLVKTYRIFEKDLSPA